MFVVRFPKSFQLKGSAPFLVNAVKGNLIKTVNRIATVSMGQTITREFGLRELKVSAFDANLQLEGLNLEPLDLNKPFRPYQMKMAKTTPINPNLELELLDFSRPVGKEFEMKMLKTTPIGPNLDFD